MSLSGKKWSVGLPWAIASETLTEDLLIPDNQRILKILKYWSIDKNYGLVVSMSFTNTNALRRKANFVLRFWGTFKTLFQDSDDNRNKEGTSKRVFYRALPLPLPYLSKPIAVTILYSKWFILELFSWKTTSHKAHLEVCLPKSRLLSGLIGMWSCMKITLIIFKPSLVYHLFL